MLTCARRIVRDDSATFVESKYYCWLTKKISSSFSLISSRRVDLILETNLGLAKSVLRKNDDFEEEVFSLSKF